MALRINPYTPGVGMVPRYLAGREALLEEAKDTLAYIANGYTPHVHSFIMACGVLAKLFC